VPHAVAADGDSPIDMKTLEGMRPLQRAGQPDVIARVIGLYLANAPSMIQDLLTAAERGETEGVYRTAHSLKSSSAMVGALRLSELCKSIETRAREALHGPVPDGVQEIELEYARVAEALTKLAGGGGS
jgi:HPt (histidine-containing phosphotransfer) domain-containing protein